MDWSLETFQNETKCKKLHTIYSLREKLEKKFYRTGRQSRVDHLKHRYFLFWSYHMWIAKKVLYFYVLKIFRKVTLCHSHVVLRLWSKFLQCMFCATHLWWKCGCMCSIVRTDVRYSSTVIIKYNYAKQTVYKKQMCSSTLVNKY